MKQCISCGMPMNDLADFAAGDTTKDYCRHCARADGTMRSYDEALAGVSGFMMQTQGMDETAARSAAAAMMAKLPAWQDHS